MDTTTTKTEGKNLLERVLARRHDQYARGHGHEGPCVLDLLEPVFGAEASHVAFRFTCYPYECDVACQQARQLLADIERLGRAAALAEWSQTIARELEEDATKERA